MKGWGEDCKGAIRKGGVAKTFDLCRAEKFIENSLWKVSLFNCFSRCVFEYLNATLSWTWFIQSVF